MSYETNSTFRILCSSFIGFISSSFSQTTLNDKFEKIIFEYIL
jgi:hypothetical protein